MVVLDTSALTAILLAEADAATYITAISQVPERLLSSATWLELSVVILAKRGDEGLRELDLIVVRGEIQVVPFTQEQAQLARDAYRVYGRGRHQAGLNYGDCFSYAVARWFKAPLLYKGNDFSHTDIQSAL